ncbi:MAG: PD-(D/E)XK nuclease domain-containing protein [Alphaproteobacteria bacterium]|nr:PD-(D/E)XK nuclease domain-containing protein [Alphaproteobacteria bacterium]
MYQTGYLSILSTFKTNPDLPLEQESLKLNEYYILGIPNTEVKESMARLIIDTEINSPTSLDNLSSELREALFNNKFESFFFLISNQIFKLIPYQIHEKSEAYYHSIFVAVLSVLGFKIEVEKSLSDGIVDCILHLEDTVLIFEFKFNQTTDIALQQILDKKYYIPFANPASSDLPVFEYPGPITPYLTIDRDHPEWLKISAKQNLILIGVNFKDTNLEHKIIRLAKGETFEQAR